MYRRMPCCLVLELLSDLQIAAKKMDLSFTEDWLSRWKDASLESEERLCHASVASLTRSQDDVSSSHSSVKV